MTPEHKARQLIDQKVVHAGLVMQDLKQLDLSAGHAVAVREYPTDTGEADHVLFVGREACGVIEAKKDEAGERLTVAEQQTARYATANLRWRKDKRPLRLLFEAIGHIVRFSKHLDRINAAGTTLQAAVQQSAPQRQDILRAAFAGQLVPQDPADERAGMLLARIRAERVAAASAKKSWRSSKPREAA